MGNMITRSNKKKAKAKFLMNGQLTNMRRLYKKGEISDD